ncbi:hypothetical protein [Hyphomicrobium sp. 99]|uniref:hypothetical protein n=1 Tax=Hyphomicrobium sp. 99 TaxID=1163419 RepID=UPI0005F77B60|nr:hypothetical protein [Hyphomicrobium sp. 99]
MPSALSPEDLKAAVEAGVIDAAQAEKLKAMRRSDAAFGPDGEPAMADEERFRFLNGFNDVFLTIGVLLVAGAFLIASSTASTFGMSWFGTLALAAATFWILSEILVARLRAVLPGMVLSVLFVAFAAAAVVVQMHWTSFSSANWSVDSEFAFWRNPSLTFGAPALIAAIIYYVRFRLPFALALIAFFGYAVVSKGLLQVAEIGPSIVALVYGLAVLAVALAYDARDTKRVTRLSDCAFWLQLVAAPLIVSPLILFIKGSTMGGATSAAILATVFLLAIFALAIDRRALLVSALLYFTVAVNDLLTGGTLTSFGADSSSFVLTLGIVGAFVLFLGVFWHPIRNRMLPYLQRTPLAPYLPEPRQ